MVIDGTATSVASSWFQTCGRSMSFSVLDRSLCPTHRTTIVEGHGGSDTRRAELVATPGLHWVTGSRQTDGTIHGVGIMMGNLVDKEPTI